MFYTRDDLAVMLAVSPATIGRMDADNQIPGRRRFRGQVRYHVPAVDAWVAGGEGDGS